MLRSAFRPESRPLAVVGQRRQSLVPFFAIVLMLVGIALRMLANAAAAPTRIYVANPAIRARSWCSTPAAMLLRGPSRSGTTPRRRRGRTERQEAYAIAIGSDEEGTSGRLVPISTATNVAGRASNVGTDPHAVSFSPNGRFAYVVNGFDAATTLRAHLARSLRST